MSALLALLACVGWECGSPYGAPSWWVPPWPDATPRVYLERSTGCLVRTDGTLLTDAAPTYLPAPQALRGIAVDVEACGAAVRAVPLTDDPDHPWVEVR